MPNRLQKNVKVLADFRRLGLIGQWFGELQLIGVGYPRWSSRRGRDIICRLACAEGHGVVRSWLKLQGRKYPICSLCRESRSPRVVHVPNLAGAQLIAAIGRLEPARRRLMDALLLDRRRIAGAQDIAPCEMVKDAYVYAVQVADPEKELNEIAAERPRETRNRSSLCSPNFMYVGA